MFSGGLNIGTLYGGIVLEDKFSNALQAAERKLVSAGQRAEVVGAGFTKVGLALVPVTAAVGGLAVASVSAATQLNATIANVSALLTNVSGAQLTRTTTEMKTKVQDLAVSMGKSTADIASGLYEVVSSLGYTSDSFGQLEIAAKAGAAGLASTQESFNFLSAVTKTYGDTSEAAFKKVADLGFQAVNIGQTTFPALAASIGGVAPIAQVAGVSLEELFAVIATATGVTGSTSEVVTQMTSALNALLDPSASLAGLFAKLGVESGQAMIAQKGFVGSLQEVAKYSKESGVSMQDLLGRKEAFIITASLAGEQAGKFSKNLYEMGVAATKAGGVVEDAFNKQTNGINRAGFAWQQFKSNLNVLLEDIGDVLIKIGGWAVEYLSPLVDVVRNAVMAFDALPMPVKAVSVAILGLVGVAGLALTALGGTVWALGQSFQVLSGLVAKSGVTHTKAAAETTVHTAALKANSLALAENALAARAQVAAQATKKFAAGEQLGLDFGGSLTRGDKGQFLPKLWTVQQADLPLSGTIEQTAKSAAKATTELTLMARAAALVGRAATLLGGWPVILGSVAAGLVLGKQGFSAIASAAGSTGTILYNIGKSTLLALKEGLFGAGEAMVKFGRWTVENVPLVGRLADAVRGLRNALDTAAKGMSDFADQAAEGNFTGLATSLQSSFPLFSQFLNVLTQINAEKNKLQSGGIPIAGTWFGDGGGKAPDSFLKRLEDASQMPWLAPGAQRSFGPGMNLEPQGVIGGADAAAKGLKPLEAAMSKIKLELDDLNRRGLKSDFEAAVKSNLLSQDQLIKQYGVSDITVKSVTDRLHKQEEALKSSSSWVKRLKDDNIELNAQLALGERAGAPTILMLDLFGKNAADVTAQMTAMGFAVSSRVKEMSDAFNRAEIDKQVAEINVGLKEWRATISEENFAKGFAALERGTEGFVANREATRDAQQAIEDYQNSMALDTLENQLSGVTLQFKRQSEQISATEKDAVGYAERVQARAAEEVAARQAVVHAWVKQLPITREVAIASKQAEIASLEWAVKWARELQLDEAALRRVKQRIAELNGEIRAMRVPFLDWLPAINAVGNAVSGIIDSIGQELGNIKLQDLAADIALVVNAFENATRAAENFAKATTNAQRFAAIAQGAGAVWQAAGAKSTVAGVAGAGISGAQLGMQIGSFIPGLGTLAGGFIGFAIGAAIGGIRAAIRVNSEWYKLAKDVGRDWGVAISEEMAKEIAKVSKVIGRLDAPLHFLPEIFQQAGGVANFGLDEAIKKTRQLFEAIGRGTITTQQVGIQLGRVFNELADEATKAGGIASAEFLELIKLQRDLGHEVKEVTEFINKQVASFSEGARKRVEAFFKSFGDLGKVKELRDLLSQELPELEIGVEEKALRDELEKVEKTFLNVLGGTAAEVQKEFSRMGLYAGVAFAETFKTQGAAAALAAAGPMFEQLNELAKTHGFTLSGTAAVFQDFYNTVKSNEDVVLALEGLNQMIVGAGNALLINQELMDNFSADALAQWTKLGERGVEAGQRWALMQPTIQSLWEAQQRFNLEVDDATQSLIDEGIQMGIVGEAGRSAQDKILSVLVAIADVLGAKLPAGLDKMGAAAEAAARKAKDAISGLPSEYIVDVRFDVENPPNFEHEMSGGSGSASPAWTGGVVGASKVLAFASGGPVPGRKRDDDWGRVVDFRPKGSDTVPAMLTPGEIVLNALGQRDISTALSKAYATANVLDNMLSQKADDGRAQLNELIKTLTSSDLSKHDALRELAKTIQAQQKTQPNLTLQVILNMAGAVIKDADDAKEMAYRLAEELRKDATVREALGGQIYSVVKQRSTAA